MVPTGPSSVCSPVHTMFQKTSAGGLACRLAGECAFMIGDLRRQYCAVENCLASLKNTSRPLTSRRATLGVVGGTASRQGEECRQTSPTPIHGTWHPFSFSLHFGAAYWFDRVFRAMVLYAGRETFVACLCLHSLITVPWLVTYTTLQIEATWLASILSRTTKRVKKEVATTYKEKKKQNSHPN
jgi:hypothetical protein